MLDRPDFNVTHYINEMFPTGANLSHKWQLAMHPAMHISAGA